MTREELRAAKEAIHEELQEIAADLEGFKYDRDEALKSIYAARARRSELRTKLAAMKGAK